MFFTVLSMLYAGGNPVKKTMYISIHNYISAVNTYEKTIGQRSWCNLEFANDRLKKNINRDTNRSSFPYVKNE